MTDQSSRPLENKIDLNPVQQRYPTRPQQNPHAISNSKPPKLLRLSEVIQRVGIKKTKIYKLQGEGTFPMRVKITPRAVGWIEDEIDVWITERIAATRFQQD